MVKRSVVSVCPFVCLFPVCILNELTYDVDMAARRDLSTIANESQGHMS